MIVSTAWYTNMQSLVVAGRHSSEREVPKIAFVDQIFLVLRESITSLVIIIIFIICLISHYKVFKVNLFKNHLKTKFKTLKV